MPGPQLANPSITSPRMGDRSRASRVSPRNITGRTYAEQHAEQDAKKAAAKIDIAEVRRAEFNRGFDAAWDKAYEAGWNAALASLDADDDGTDEPGDEQVDR